MFAEWQGASWHRDHLGWSSPSGWLEEKDRLMQLLATFHQPTRAGCGFPQVAAPHNGQRSQGGKREGFSDLENASPFPGNSHHQNQYLGTHMFIYPDAFVYHIYIYTYTSFFWGSLVLIFTSQCSCTSGSIPRYPQNAKLLGLFLLNFWERGLELLRIFFQTFLALQIANVGEDNQVCLRKWMI